MIIATTCGFPFNVTVFCEPSKQYCCYVHVMLDLVDTSSVGGIAQGKSTLQLADSELGM